MYVYLSCNIKVMVSIFPYNSAIDSGDTCESRGDDFELGSQRDDFSELRILTTNVCSLCQGCGELSMLAASATPHLLCIMETHLNGDSGPSPTPAGYVPMAHTDRSEHGGGVSHKDLLCDVVDTTRYYVLEKAELCAVCFSGTIAVCVYSRPSPGNLQCCMMGGGNLGLTFVVPFAVLIADDVDSAMSHLTNQILTITERLVPHCKPGLAHPVPWWNIDCQQVWLAKLSAWNCGDSRRFVVWPSKLIFLLFSVTSGTSRKFYSIRGLGLILVASY